MLARGIIFLWYGSIASIPPGFVLCNGSNGTPDLRNKFVPGAGDTYAPGATGGNITHTHTFTTDGHNHTLEAGDAIAEGEDLSSVSSGAQDSGTTDTENGLPPYHALAYIMKT